MNTIRYINGDATKPEGFGPRIIAHVVNDRGGWGRGFVMSLSRRWKAPEKAYRAWHAAPHDGRELPFLLGETQMVRVEERLWVANMIAQEGYSSPGRPAIRYNALQKCLRFLCTFAHARDASVHMPRVGCGLAGGSWSQVEPIINAELVAEGVDVTVYDY